MSATAITPRSTSYSDWYHDVIAAAELAEHSDVRGCMVIRPNGFAIWEAIQADLDRRFKEVGVQNAYFPLFIPKSFLAKEASHVEGFAMECAVVTHYGLKAERHGEHADVVVDKTKELEEALIVRPTSETIINATFAKWVQSWRDLPLLINQWCNVCRWEMRTRLFLRTAEFLWQEGHTAHASQHEAEEFALKMLGVYREFMEQVLALPVIPGKKTDKERFAGADTTYTVEAMMQNKWALQAATSHNLGQNFAKAFGTKFQNKAGQQEFVWQTSWGASTRLIGALIMTHADDNGLILPPKVARTKAVIVPIYKSNDEKTKVLAAADKLRGDLAHLGVKVDDRDEMRPGDKYYYWERRGVPLRLELGPKDLEKNQTLLVRRLDKAKKPTPLTNLRATVEAELESLQTEMFEKAKAMRMANTFEINSYADFKKRLEGEEAGGFFLCHWDGTTETEARLKQETKATIRCIPLDAKDEAGQCMITGKPSPRRVIMARAY